MDYISLPDDTKITIWDRFVYAYYAFRMQVKPDLKLVLEHITRMQEAEDEKFTALEQRQNQSIDKLTDGFDRAMVHSIASATDNWREMFDQAMLNIELLPVEDQIIIMQYMFRGNRYIVATQRFRQWMANHAEAILDNLPE
jgi:hypothetical protein